MNLFPELQKAYTDDKYTAREAQKMAEFIAFGPVVFQVAGIMLKRGILDLLRDNPGGMTCEELVKATGMSKYAINVLTDSALTIGIIIVDAKNDRFALSKVGMVLLIDPSIRINMNFNNDVNYEGFFHLEEALDQGKPAGLKHFGDWPTIYEGLSQLPPKVQKSWFDFDHFYSDNSFNQALEIVFKHHKTRSLFDVGGNTGRWAELCVGYDDKVEVTILDLPQQLEMMHKAVAGKKGSERIKGHAIDMLDRNEEFPLDPQLDAIWMSQFLDCFGEDEIVSILSRAADAMNDSTRIYIMETLWDRQKYPTAAFCLTQISLYFTAMANGNSKMYHSDQMTELVERSGLQVERIYDGLGWGHSMMVCKKNN